MTNNQKACIFCKIVKKELSSHIIYENEYIIGFLDINPFSKGHCLIIPKNHVVNIKEMDKESWASYQEAIKKISHNIAVKLGAKGFNYLSNEGAISGQEVFHAHLHIIPRYLDSNKNLWLNTTTKSIKQNEENFKELRKKIMCY